MLEFLKSIDQLYLDIPLTYNGKAKFKTLIGAIVTIFSFLGIAVCSIFFSKDMLNKTNPNIIYKRLASVNNEYENLNHQNYFLGIGLEDNLGNSLEFDESYLNISATYNVVNMKAFINNKTSEFLNIINCNYTNAINYTFSDNLNTDLSFLVCLSNLNNTVGGYYDNQIAKYLELKVSQCDSKVKVCKSDDEIKKYIKGKTVGVYHLTNLIDVDNYTDPIKDKLNYKQVNLDPSRNYDLELFYQKVTIDTDDGWLATNYNQYKDIMLQTFNINPAPYNNDAYLTVSIYLTNYTDYYRRIYIKITTVFANMGGIIKFIFIFGKLIIYLFQAKIFQIDLINKLYKFNLVKDEDKLLNLEMKNYEIKNSMIMSDKDIVKKKRFWGNAKNNSFIKVTKDEIVIDKSSSINHLGNIINEDNKKNNINMSNQNLEEQSINKKIELNPHIIEDFLKKEGKQNYEERSINKKIQINLEYIEDYLNKDKNLSCNNKLKQKTSLLTYQPVDIFISICCCKRFYNKNLTTKENVFNKTINQGLQYVEMLNIFNTIMEIKMIKMIIFNECQFKSFKYLTKPSYDMSYLEEDKAKNNEKNKLSNYEFKQRNERGEILELFNYYQERKRENKLKGPDFRILELIDPNLKKILHLD